MLPSAMPVPYVKLLRRIQKITKAPKKEADPAERAIWAEIKCDDLLYCAQTSTNILSPFPIKFSEDPLTGYVSLC